MRGMCLILLVFVAGCASHRPTEDQPASVYLGSEGLVYETTRPAGPAVDGRVTADLTLVDLDEALARGLLGVASSSDISPQSFREPIGEVAAVNACYGHGRVLARSSIAVKPNEEARWQWSMEHVYLQDWKLDGESKSPLFSTVTDGVDAKLTFMPVNVGDSIKLESVSSQVAWPMQDFTTSVGTGARVKIQIPNLAVVERVGTETLQPGETAMFQLSRAAHEDGARIRLLFVRLVVAE
jgi:hypothetical protein